MPMTGLDALQSAQYMTLKGKRLVVMDADDWEKALEWLEDVEDSQIVRRALAELKASGGNREKAGWLKWDNVKDTL